MLHRSVKKYDSPIEGTGLQATGFIAQGTVVAGTDEGDQYQILTRKERDELDETLRDLAYRYGKKFFLARDGSEYMNHSCDPNTWWIDDDTMTARRDVQPGEEITYDYASSEAHPWWRSKWPCWCGSNICRGFVTGRDCLDTEFQLRHKDHLPTWTLEFIERNRGIRGHFTAGLYFMAETVRRSKAMLRHLPK